MQPAPLTALFLQERVFLSVSNYIFTAIFVAEMTMKVPAPQESPGVCPLASHPLLPSSSPLLHP